MNTSFNPQATAKTMWARSVVASAVLSAAMLAGCSTTDDVHSPLNRAHASYRMLESDPKAGELSALEMADAREALKAADESWARRDKRTLIDHLAYVAQQRVSIARETLSAKTWEGEAAASKIGLVKDKADRDVAAARIGTQEMAVELAVASAEVKQGKARTSELDAQLKVMGAKQTAHGDVVTLGDVLFDTNRFELRPAGLRDLDKLVDFLNRHPERKALIEGFTDSRGGDEANLVLSQRRADALRSALIAHGVQAARLSARGYGEAHPTSDNGTAAGRQMNRRVEVVLSEDGGNAAGR